MSALAGALALLAIAAILSPRVREVITFVLREPTATLMLLGATLLFFLTPQMPDMLLGTRAAVDRDGSVRETVINSLGTPLAAGFAGVLGWFWTRAGLLAWEKKDDWNRWFAPPEQRLVPNPSIQWAGRLPLLLAAVLIAAPVLVRGIHDGIARVDWEAWLTVLLGALVNLGLFFVVSSHKWRKRLASGHPTPRKFWNWHTTSLVAGAPGGWRTALVVLSLSLLGYGALLAWPGLVESHLHTPDAALLALGLLFGPLALSLAAWRDGVFWLMRAVRWVQSRLLGGQVHFMGLSDRPWRNASAWIGLGLFVWLIYFAGFWQRGDRYMVPRLATILHEPISPGDACKDDGQVLPDGSLRRPCLGQALAAWHQARLPFWTGPGPMPLVIVAAQGGASRAAIWLLSVMRDLDHSTGEAFGRHVFAISAASGGALGAVSYLQALGQHTRPDGGLDWQRPRVVAMLDHLSRADLLSASIATYFLHDTLAALWGRMHPLGGMDRGRVLEGAFARHWSAGAGLGLGEGIADGGLVALHQNGGPAMPHLLLNGTDRSSGRRAITATFRFRPADEILPGADDFLSLLNHPARTEARCPGAHDPGQPPTAVCGQDVSAATAVHNSARFPFISPAGRFNHSASRQLLDGGYFDNNGAETALDLLRALRREASMRGIEVDPIIVAVSNNADSWADREVGRRDRGEKSTLSNEDARFLDETTVACCLSLSECGRRQTGARDDLSITERTAAERGASTGLTAQLLVPLAGLAAVRGAQDQQALLRLRRELCPRPAGDGNRRSFFHIALPKPPIRPAEGSTGGGPYAAPMNWVLNASASRFMLRDDNRHGQDAQTLSPAFDNSFNRQQAQRLWERLQPSVVVGAECR